MHGKSYQKRRSRSRGGGGHDAGGIVVQLLMVVAWRWWCQGWCWKPTFAWFWASLALSKVPSGAWDFISWYSSNKPFLHIWDNLIKKSNNIFLKGKIKVLDFRSHLVLFLTYWMKSSRVLPPSSGNSVSTWAQNIKTVKAKRNERERVVKKGLAVYQLAIWATW